MWSSPRRGSRLQVHQRSSDPPPDLDPGDCNTTPFQPAQRRVADGGCFDAFRVRTPSMLQSFGSKAVPGRPGPRRSIEAEARNDRHEISDCRLNPPTRGASRRGFHLDGLGLALCEGAPKLSKMGNCCWIARLHSRLDHELALSSMRFLAPSGSDEIKRRGRRLHSLALIFTENLPLFWRETRRARQCINKSHETSRSPGCPKGSAVAPFLLARFVFMDPPH